MVQILLTAILPKSSRYYGLLRLNSDNPCGKLLDLVHVHCIYNIELAYRTQISRDIWIECSF